MAPDTVTQAQILAKKTSEIAKQYKKTILTAICSPSLFLGVVSKQAKPWLRIGAQGVAADVAVAQTGFVNASQLKSLGAEYVIVGHSEMRARGETNESVALQTMRLLEKKLKPIICVGERDRDMQGWYLSDIKEQLEVVLAAIPKAGIKNTVIAYEPVWAIGAQALREATPAECREMIIFIRKIISDLHGEKVANSIPILYGGSVNDENAKSFIIEGTAQGLLVGRVSLEPKRFGLLAKSIATL